MKPVALCGAFLLALSFGCSRPSAEAETSASSPPPVSAPAEGPAVPALTCSADADCRLFSDYCTGCDCRALHEQDQDPGCEGPGVRCLVDPCDGKSVRCNAGRCEIGAASE